MSTFEQTGETHARVETLKPWMLTKWTKTCCGHGYLNESKTKFDLHQRIFITVVRMDKLNLYCMNPGAVWTDLKALMLFWCVVLVIATFVQLTLYNTSLADSDYTLQTVYSLHTGHTLCIHSTDLTYTL